MTYLVIPLGAQNQQLKNLAQPALMLVNFLEIVALDCSLLQIQAVLGAVNIKVIGWLVLMLNAMKMVIGELQVVIYVVYPLLNGLMEDAANSNQQLICSQFCQ